MLWTNHILHLASVAATAGLRFKEPLVVNAKQSLEVDLTVKNKMKRHLIFNQSVSVKWLKLAAFT